MRARDSAQYSRFFGLEGLEVLTARWLERSFAPHMHDFYAVSLNYGGRGAFDCRNKSRDAVPGSCNLTDDGANQSSAKTAEIGESIPQVASRCGFCDQSHLNRCFKRTLGITPWEYARPAATDLPNYFQQKIHIVALQTMIDTAGAKYGLAANLRPRHKHTPVFLQPVQQSVVQLIDVRRIHPVGEVRWTVLET